ncbi:Sas10_Utp3 domain-containing protein [Cephalotus follicularis]|uniref:Sas10_Utp3 domain-containing protein n=1 Tax=Cephalotus follicularis TaxID=3775 RepID=A0A1Q3BFZ2_CEPFO|nr:Sas10_Utp3 domain-containing protein [Cephalotus follicularis]
MEETTNSDSNEIVKKEAPQLVSLLKEMKAGLETVRTKVQALTAKVKADNYLTVEGISYLESKHLLLLNYCQAIVYYLLRKAKGFSIEGHPVARSLVEIRLFLEKIRPIDKKLQYQIRKLTTFDATSPGLVGPNEKESGVTQKTEDLLKHRPNPELLIGKSDITTEDNDQVYRPPKMVPTTMGDDKMSKHERNAIRKEREVLRQATQSAYVRDLMNDMEGRPDEIREFVGAESRELTRYLAKRGERDRREEELFTRAPVTKAEKRIEKHLKKSRNGLLDLADNFYDEIKTLPLEVDIGEPTTGISYGSRRTGKPKKRQRRH